MQDDLNRIYQWAEENVMKFNERKFKQLTWGKMKDIGEVAHLSLTAPFPQNSILGNSR